MTNKELLEKLQKELKQSSIYCQTQIEILNLCKKAEIHGEMVNPRDILRLIQEQRQKLQLL